MCTHVLVLQIGVLVAGECAYVTLDFFFVGPFFPSLAQVGYEFLFPIHSPLITRIQVLKRGFIGRNKNACAAEMDNWTSRLRRLRRLCFGLCSRLHCSDLGSQIRYLFAPRNFMRAMVGKRNVIPIDQDPLPSRSR